MVKKFGVSPAFFRLSCEADLHGAENALRPAGVTFYSVPGSVVDPDGFLAKSFLNKNPSHGNVHYGKIILDDIAGTNFSRSMMEKMRERAPVQDLPSHCFWRRAHNVGIHRGGGPCRFGAVPHRRKRKGGHGLSFFAQHIAKHLSDSGYNYMVTDLPVHPSIPDDVARKHNYGVFTARYGNIYTPRQLLQLCKRAYGLFEPIDDFWINEQGRYIDPYRPAIEPRGFGSRQEFELDRKRHFAAVRKALEELSVFVFTFGLTETFVNAVDGAVYPVCPGVVGGEFDKNNHVFKNFTVQEITADFLEFIDFVRAKNSDVKFIITVSPVPLVATAEDRSVITSTVYSKAVLRVACEEISKARLNVVYFPSLEIITGNYTRGKYFGEDLLQRHRQRCRSCDEAFHVAFRRAEHRE